MEYKPDQKSQLIKCFGNLGFKFIKDVDVIEQYFNKIQNIVSILMCKSLKFGNLCLNSKKLKSAYIPEEAATGKNRVFLDDQYKNLTFSIQQNSKGRCRITFMKDNKFSVVANHLGDVKNGNKEISESTEIIKNFRQLIEICTKLLAGLKIQKHEELSGFEVRKSP